MKMSPDNKKKKKPTATRAAVVVPVGLGRAGRFIG